MMRYGASWHVRSAGLRLVATVMSLMALMAFSGCSDDDPVAPKPNLDPTRSTVAVSEAVAGEAVTITVQSRDGQGNPVDFGGAAVVISVSGANTASPAVTDHEDGTYSASYIPVNIGTDTIEVTMNGVAIEGSPRSATVRVGDVDAVQSLASVPPGTVGETSRIVVEARDKAGNPVDHGGALVTVEIRGANPGTPAVTDHGDGSYSASYVPMVSGTDKVTVNMNGRVVAGAAISVPVALGALDPFLSIADVPDGRVGEDTEILVQTRDVGGNPLESGGASVTVSVSGANEANSLPVMDLGDGSYRASYSPQYSGSDFVSVTVNGAALAGSPFESKVGSGTAAAGQTILGLPEGAEVGTTASITLQTRDAGGNALSTGGAAVAVMIAGANAGMPEVMDRGDGTYSADYAPMLAGQDQVTITINGTDVPGSPFLIQVKTGPVSAARTSMSVAGGSVGETVTVQVQGRDVGGNPVSKGGAAIEVEITGANAGMVPVRDNHNGTYTATYTPLHAGLDEITVRVGGEPLAGGSTSLAIGVGGPDAAQSTAVISGGQVGTVTSVFIQARDAGGNSLSKGGAAIEVQIAGANAGTASIKDNYNGTYIASYTPLKAGQDQITVTLGGKPVGGSPYTQNIQVGVVSAGHSSANLVGGTAGEQVSMYLQARDVGGNSLSKGGASVQVQVTGANGNVPSVKDNHNGTYNSSYTPTKAGLDNVVVTLNGEPVAGSPFTIKISPGKADAGQTTANVAGGSVGSATTIYVQTRDVGGNPIATGGAAIHVSVSGANPGTPAIKDNHNGTYLASYVRANPGTDLVDVTVDGVAIAGSPFTVNVIGDFGPDASMSTASVPAGKVGEPTAITVVVRDASGDNLDEGGADVSITITGANPGSPAVTDNNNGTYSASYVPMKAGLDQFEITLDGDPVGTEAKSSAVSPGAVSGAHSSASVSGADMVGGTVSIYVQARDVGGNPVSKGGAPVSISVSGPNAGAPGVKDNHNGTYLASYAAGAMGTDVISVTLNGEAVTGSPFSWEIGPAEADAGSSTASIPAGKVGVVSTIVVQSRDALGNVMSTGGATVTVSVSGANIASPAVNDYGDGDYYATYIPMTPGTDVFTITLDGEAISGSPFMVAVVSGDPNAGESSVTVGDGRVGFMTPITVVTRDAGGNPLTTGGATVTATVSGANTGTLWFTDQGDGTYTTNYVPGVSGTDTIVAKVNGNTVGGGPYTSDVSDVIVEASVEAVSGDVTEGEDLVFSVYLNEVAASDVVVSYSSAGSGGNPAAAADFDGGSFPAGSVTIPAGEISVQISFTTATDVLVEGTEEATLTLTGTSGAPSILGSTVAVVATIAD